MSVERSELSVERSPPRGAVFLSYASQDAAAAKRICEALRSAGVEVWFDQSELVGGDAWDQKIRQQIKECALFIPILSKATQGRRVAYFRLEWRLADERTHLMAKGTPFLLPVTIDDTNDRHALVPDSFLAVQWSKLPAGETTAAFSARVNKLLSGEGVRRVPQGDPTFSLAPGPGPSGPKWLRPVLAAVTVVITVMAVTLIYKHDRVVPAVPLSLTPAPLSEARQLVEKAWQLSEVSKVNPEAMRSAAEMAERAIQLDPADGDVWATAALVDMRCYVHSADRTEKREEMARAKVLKAKALAPRSVRVRLADARMLVELDLYVDGGPKAEAILRELLREKSLDGDATEVLGSLGIALQKQKRYLEAGQVLEQAGRQNGGWLNAASWAYLVGRKLPEAQSAAERQVALDPTFGLMQLYLVQMIREDLGAAQAALDRLPAATRLEEASAQGYARLAWVRRDPEALLAATGALPGDYVTGLINGPKAFVVAMAHQLAGRPEAARVEWTKALAVVEHRLAAETTSQELLGFRLMLLALLGRREEAEQVYRLQQQLRGSGENGGDPGELLVLGRNEEALVLLEKELRKSPGLWLHFDARFDPFYDPLRGDPRFEKLLRDTLPPGAKPFDELKPAVAPPVADKSVAVLAFANLSDDKANEYFSDGISEELLNVLAKVSGLKVTARTSSFHFKGKDTPIPEIAQQLGVAYVVEGSVRKSGDKVRITAQLIKAADGFHVWSDTFTRDPKDVFAVQDEIAGLIAQALQLKLDAAPRTAVTVDPEVHQLYLRARAEWGWRTTAGYDRAEPMLREVLRRDPEFAPAYALLAAIAVVRDEALAGFDPAGGLPPWLATAQAYAEKARELDPQSPESFVALGGVYSQQFKLVEAERELRHAITLNPNHAGAHQWLARLLEVDGEMDEAIALAQRATQLDPLSARVFDNLALVLMNAGRMGEARAAVDRALLLQPGSPQALAFKARLFVDAGEIAPVKRLFDEFLQRANPLAQWDADDCQLVAALINAGEPGPALAAYQRIPARYLTAKVTAAIEVGRMDEALAWLKQGHPSFWPANVILWNPSLDPIRNQPEFQSFLQQAGLREAHGRVQAWRAAHGPEKPVAKK